MMGDWEAAMIDRLNELARENRKYFEEVENGQQAAILIREIHGQFNTLRMERDQLKSQLEASRTDTAQARYAHENAVIERDRLKSALEQARKVISQCEDAIQKVAGIADETRLGWALQAIEQFNTARQAGQEPQ